MKPASRSFGIGQALLLVGTFSALLFGAAACVSDPEGTTPDCTQDVGDGTHQNIENGCNPFAVCLVGDKIVNPEECCKNLTNDYEHALCLYGYGAAPPPNSGSSSSSSSSGK